MTLAHKIARELALPAAERRFAPNIWASTFRDIHCFELSQVREQAHALARSMKEKGAVPERLMFLPAPCTWIEWAEPERGRLALLLADQADGTVLICPFEDGIKLGSANPSRGTFGAAWQHLPKSLPRVEWIAGAFLALINSPRLVGGVVHAPHAGLQRELVRKQKLVGKFPLHAWTEITLRTGAAKAGTDRETRLTGQTPLHFCRAHLQRYAGEWRLVASYWRGNPALGMKRTRYRVIPGEQQAGELDGHAGGH